DRNHLFDQPSIVDAWIPRAGARSRFAKEDPGTSLERPEVIDHGLAIGGELVVEVPGILRLRVAGTQHDQDRVRQESLRVLVCGTRNVGTVALAEHGRPWDAEVPDNEAVTQERLEQRGIRRDTGDAVAQAGHTNGL